MTAPFPVSLPRLSLPVYRLSEIPCRSSCGGCSGELLRPVGRPGRVSGHEMRSLLASGVAPGLPASSSLSVLRTARTALLLSRPVVEPCFSLFIENTRARSTLVESRKLLHLRRRWPRPDAQLHLLDELANTLLRDPLFRHFLGSPSTRLPWRASAACRPPRSCACAGIGALSGLRRGPRAGLGRAERRSWAHSSTRTPPPTLPTRP